MSSFILNIGRDRSAKGEIWPGGTVTQEDVTMCLSAARFKVLHVERRFHSDREDTYVAVAEFEGEDHVPAIQAVSRALDQDCIAVARYKGATFLGALIGPRADEWGRFNPAMFDMPRDYSV